MPFAVVSVFAMRRWCGWSTVHWQRVNGRSRKDHVVVTGPTRGVIHVQPIQRGSGFGTFRGLPRSASDEEVRQQPVQFRLTSAFGHADPQATPRAGETERGFPAWSGGCTASPRSRQAGRPSIDERGRVSTERRRSAGGRRRADGPMGEPRGDGGRRSRDGYAADERAAAGRRRPREDDGFWADEPGRRARGSLGDYEDRPRRSRSREDFGDRPRRSVTHGRLLRRVPAPHSGAARRGRVPSAAAGR